MSQEHVGPTDGETRTNGSRTSESWSWDPSLYAGSARYYPLGRVPYPPGVADELVAAVPLDGSGLLLDVGCGPGSLTLLLAPYVADAIGVDADPDMLSEASRLAAERQIRNVAWRHLRAEDLPADLPRPRVVTFAQSFHWMDQPRVAAAVRTMLVADGAVVHVGATTHEGIDGGGDPGKSFPHPRPPRQAISALVVRYLGTERRAGQGVLTSDPKDKEDEVYRAAGFEGPQRIEVPGRLVERTVEEVVASVYSRSISAPHLFGPRINAFDDELRSLLEGASDAGLFSEQMRSVTLSIWR